MTAQEHFEKAQEGLDHYPEPIYDEPDSEYHQRRANILAWAQTHAILGVGMLLEQLVYPVQVVEVEKS